MQNSPPNFFLQVTGKQTARAAKQTAADPFAARSSRVVRVLLGNPRRGWQVRQLAAEARVSLGLAAKVKQALLEQAFVEIRDRLVYLRDPRALLDAWATGYAPPTERLPLYVMEDPAAAMVEMLRAALRSELSANARTRTGSTSVASVRPTLPGRPRASADFAGCHLPSIGPTGSGGLQGRNRPAQGQAERDPGYQYPNTPLALNGRDQGCLHGLHTTTARREPQRGLGIRGLSRRHRDTEGCHGSGENRPSMIGSRPTVNGRSAPTAVGRKRRQLRLRFWVVPSGPRDCSLQRFPVGREPPQISLGVTFPRPHGLVGGDFYRVERLDADRYALLVADVMGHGVAAAMYAMQLGGIWDELRDELSEPAAFLQRLNQRLHPLVRQCGYFATAVMVLYDASRGECRCARAGHPAPLLFRAGGVERVGRSRPALGVFPDQVYDESTVTLGAGDSLLMFSDGAVELVDAAKNGLGIDGLLALVGRQDCEGPESCFRVARLEEQLLRYSDGIRLPDDLTLIKLRRAGC